MRTLKDLLTFFDAGEGCTTDAGTVGQLLSVQAALRTADADQLAYQGERLVRDPGV